MKECRNGECRNIRFCELRQREVINLCDGRRLGCVADILLDMCNGCVEAIIIPGPVKLCGFFGYDAEYIIPFECIRKVGPDIILVEVVAEKFLKSCK